MAITKICAGLALLGLLMTGKAGAQVIVIEDSIVVDYRPVVARVEAADTATARSRLQGEITALTIDEGDTVKTGDTIAVIIDSTLDPQLAALSAQVEAVGAQVAQAQDNIARAETLFADGFYPKARLDQERTALEVLQRNLASAASQRQALAARKSEGRLRAPVDGRVTQVNVVNGSIVSPGEVIASFATLDGLVRLALPERHAAQLKAGETVSLRLPSRGGDVRVATITRIYPELRDGAVIADAAVQGGLNALVGERVDVLVPVGERRAVRIPGSYVSTRYGVDFVRVKVGARFIDAPVALAGPLPEADGQVEVLTGLRPGDQIEPAETPRHEG